MNDLHDTKPHEPRATDPRDPQSPPPSTSPPKPHWLRWAVLGVLVLLIGLLIGSTEPVFKAVFATKTAMRMMTDAKADDHASHDHEAQGGAVTYYTCGMHPWVILPKPGDCPICHMKLEPIDPKKFTGEVSIDPLVVQNMGVRIEPVVEGPLIKTIRTVGTVDYDETRLVDVNIKVNGWIEKLHVNYLGDQVAKDQPLFELYSPELYAAQEEYLLALRNEDKVGADFVPDAAQGARDLLESARTKLEYYDINGGQIEALRQRGKPAKTMTIRSPADGVVIAKHANEGMKVDPGMQAYRIADLSEVWVMVTLYEYQLPYVSVGQKATMTLPYIPGVEFEGEVIYVYPYMDSKTRQVNVRLEFANPNRMLKPGMYANIELRNQLAASKTLVPRSAVIDTGRRQVAFVSLGEGKFEPRNVTLGVETMGGQVQVIDGLKPGEMVVTSGQFLLDSEAKIREALAKMIRGEPAATQQAAAKVEGTSELATLPDTVAERIVTMLDAYFAVGDKLASDTAEGIDAPARQIAASVDALVEMPIPDKPHFWHQHDEAATVRGKALELIDAKDIKAVRLAYADLSLAAEKLIKATGVPPQYSKPVQALHCPMYREGQGGSMWLQPAGDVRNPFYGSTMLECFDKRVTMPVTGGAVDAKPTPKVQAPAEAPSSVAITPDQQAAVDRIVSAYLAIQQALTQDQLPPAVEALAPLRESAETLAKASDGDLAASARAVVEAGRIHGDDLVAFRDGLKKLTAAVQALAQVAPPTSEVGTSLNLAYCPMVKAYWLQRGDQIANPYDSSMLRCGRIDKPLPVRQTGKDKD
ncbi:efflux RND transporter periplasmic adaptor subunit [Planctomycetales bacterium ZRK34]|nr:efflux RND transporter periplasmic adaptor subunit [Planctomycetales bacterium ZRK34]